MSFTEEFIQIRVYASTSTTAQILAGQNIFAEKDAKTQ
jgi:hypothetical protein